MTANERNGAEVPEPLFYGDADAVAASGMPLPSLRVLQAAGAIQAQKTPKDHGGFKRMWCEEDVLIASIGAAMSEHFAWNIRIVAEAMAKTRPDTWAALTASIAETISSDAGALIRSSKDDWHLDLINRKLLFLRLPPHYAALGDVQGQLPDAAVDARPSAGTPNSRTNIHTGSDPSPSAQLQNRHGHPCQRAEHRQHQHQHAGPRLMAPPPRT
jgi:hypothetical protein